MANRDRAFGFRPVGSLADLSKTGRLRVYNADASRTAANEAGTIFVGDPVIIEADGNVTAITATPTDAAVGVCVGILPFENQRDGFGNGTSPHGDLVLQRKHLPAGVAGKVLVAQATNDALFEVQEVGTGTALTLADVGNNINITAPTEHGSTSTGKSLFVLDNTTEATTATLQFKIVAPVIAPDNEVGAVAQRWIVKFNRSHFNVAGMTGV